MIRGSSSVVLAVALVAAAAACGDDAGPQEPMDDLPGADAAELWSYMQDEAYTSDWTLWPGKGEMYEGQEPHGMLLTTYLNDLALNALTGDAATMPAGAIIVKENYTPAGDLAAITTMYKVDGYDTAHNDWHWAKYAPDGEIQASGKVESCTSCHEAQASNDYLFTGTLQ